MTKATQRVPLGLLAPFLGLLLLPLSGVLWMGGRLLEQDRILETKRTEEQFEHAMEAAAAAIQQRISAAQVRMGCGDIIPAESGAYAASLELESGQVRHCAGEPVPWMPVARRLPEASPESFATGEHAEFVEKNLPAALDQYTALTHAPTLAVRAGALLRKGRVLRNLNRAIETLPIYAAMADFRGVAVAGLPSDLVARTARCRVLSELRRTDQLRVEALALARDLDNGRWALDSAAFEVYRDDAAGWSGLPRDSARERLAVAAASVFVRWRSGKLDGEPFGTYADSDLTVLWRKHDVALEVLIARPAWVSRVLLHSSPPDPVEVYIPSGNGRGAGVRHYAGLPWPVTGTWRNIPANGQEFFRRRELVLGFLAVAMLLTAGSAWLLWRGFTRERALSRLQSDFVSAVSHEFRTPLTSMKQIAEVLADGRLIQEDRRQTYYETLGRATHRLQRLVESLLDFARMEAKAMPYRKDWIELREMARELAGDFAHEYARNGFFLEAREPAEELVVRGDREALGQAVWNLLDNAVKYSPEQKTVRLETARRGASAVLRVSDQGIGIPKHEQKRISEKFFRGEAAKSAGIKGTGIGLSLVDHIVRSHKGTLEVESEPGKGSTFTIALPLEEVHP